MVQENSSGFSTDKETKNFNKFRPGDHPGSASGVMNPYILAGIVLGKPSTQTFSSEDMIKAMNQCEGGRVSKYKEIFDPDKSPIFAPTDLKKFLSGYKDNNLPFGGGKAGVGNPAYENLQPVKWDAADTNNVKCGSRTRAEYITDVIQGACLNCYFMSALYSIVWTYYGTFPINLVPVNNYYSIIFYTYPDLTKVTIKVKATFPVNQNGHLVYAQETPQAELWPALYEKAYAKFFPLSDSALPNAAAGEDPEIGTFPPYMAIISLTNLTKLLSSLYPKNGIPPTQYNPANLGGWGNSSYDVLTKCNLVGGVTSWATVVWTYDSGSIPNNASAYFYNPALIPCHAYSVLGGFTNAAGVSYVVLRNPWGNQIDPVNDATLNSLKGSLSTDSWMPANGPTIKFGSNADGIFALESSVFDKCFTGFGWVRP